MAASTMASTQALSLQSFHSLHEGLLGIKHTTEEAELYPNHAVARGGIGAFLATGARGGVSHLPKPKRHGAALRGTGRSASARTYAAGATGGSSFANGGGSEAPTTPGRSGSHSPLHQRSGLSAHQQGGGAAALGSTVGTTSSPQSPAAAEIEGAAVKEWRRGVQHVNNFTTAARSSRPHDVPPASRWVGISFYENDPQQVKRHMDVMAWVDQVHTHSKLLDREKERHRHAAWAEEQREMFRRQRVEQAARYLRAGLPPTPSYAWTEASRPATGATGMSLPLSTGTFTTADWRSSFGARTSDNGLGQSASTAGGSSKRRPHTAMPAAIPLPKQSFHRVQDRIYSEQADAPMSAAETLRQAAQDSEARRQAASVADQMRELDDFELHLRALGRQQLAQQQAMHQQYAERSRGGGHHSPSSRATGAVH